MNSDAKKATSIRSHDGDLALQRLAELLRQRNVIDALISELIERASYSGHVDHGWAQSLAY